MNTDRIFISSSKTEEGKKGVSELINGLSKINRKVDFISNELKTKTVSVKDKGMILEKLSNAGVTILVMSSDFLNSNHHLLRINEDNSYGWNYEELSASLLWNTVKMHNSIIITYTDEFCKEYMKAPHNFSFPIINDNINNLNFFKACEKDDKNYIEVISLTEFLSKPKFYLNKVDRKKVKQSTHDLYKLKFA